MTTSAQSVDSISFKRDRTKPIPMSDELREELEQLRQSIDTAQCVVGLAVTALNSGLSDMCDVIGGLRYAVEDPLCETLRRMNTLLGTHD